MSEDACGAILSIADDYGDNSATVRCQLLPGHDGRHSEKFEREDCGKVEVMWEKDQRIPCPLCGKLVDGAIYLRSCEYGANWDNPDDDTGCWQEMCDDCNCGNTDSYDHRCPKHKGM